MRYAFYSPDYYPIVGGLSAVVAALAAAMASLGHRVVVITRTPGGQYRDQPFEVVRQPGWQRCRQLVQEADHLVLFNFAFKSLPSWVGSGTPMTVIHNGVYPATWSGQLKVAAARLLARHHLAVSRFAARPFSKCTVMPMPFQRARYVSNTPLVARRKELLFVGRLVSQKGAHVLLEALAQARAQGAVMGLTIAGEGPERGNLEKQVAALGLVGQVLFAGTLEGHALADCLGAHQVLVVPSVGPEGFGLVALEGMAAGCLVVAAASGGLVEAVGPGGHLFPPGDAGSLCRLLLDTRGDWPGLQHRQQALSEPHLSGHTPEAAARVLEAITREAF